MKDLPYFKWYPADAETDANFREMSDAEIGFYVRCLNHSWINGWLPADPKTRARVLHTRLDTANRYWLRVGKCFEPDPQNGEKLYNFRQETERRLASQRSLKASESVKHRYERTTNVSLRAYDSVSVSEVLSSKGGVGGNGKLPEAARFSEWLAPWPRVAEPDAAARAWLSVVDTAEKESAAFAARDRYLASDEVSRGAVMEPAKWLFAQTPNFAGRWPKSKSNGRIAMSQINEGEPETPERRRAGMEWMAAHDPDPQMRAWAAEELRKSA